MKKTLVYLIAVLFSLSACQKNLDTLIPDSPSPGTTWYNTIPDTAPVNSLKASLKLELQSADSFTVFSSGTTGYSGGSFDLFFSIPQGALMNDASGQTFSGMAYIKTLLLKTKGDFIKMGMPTTSNGSLLVSGGAFYVSLKDANGNNLSISPNHNIGVTFNDTPVFQQMKVFHGNQVAPSGFNWLPAADTQLNQVSAGTNFYITYTNKLDWVGCSYSYDNTGSGTVQTRVAIDLPSYYTNANSIVYLAFDDMKSVIELSGDAVTRQFRSPLIPVGKQATIVVMSKQANDYFLGSTQTITTTAAQGGFQNVTMNSTISSLPEIKSYLSTL